jgi:hypothetical protein
MDCPTCGSDEKDMPYVGHGATIDEWQRCDECGDVLCPDSWHKMEKVYCLVCDKELDYNACPSHRGGVNDGGFMLVSFHYGSCHDQCHGFHGRKSHRDAPPMHPYTKLLTCDEIEAFICDNCFEKKFDKMKGYDIEKNDRVKIV